jgi:hypothetical protein
MTTTCGFSLRGRPSCRGSSKSTARRRDGWLLFNVYDSNPALLVETDGRGRYLLSGYVHDRANHPDPLEYFGERLTEDRLEVRFELPKRTVDVWLRD